MNTQSGYEVNEAARFGEFWIRMLAYFIDMAILISAGIAIFLPVGVILSLLEMEMNSPLFDIFNLVMV